MQRFVVGVVRRFGGFGRAWWTQSFRSQVRCSHGELNMDDDYYSIDAILAENQVEYSYFELGDFHRY